ncbi:MerR family transcriptional regulator [Luteipulveratus sp. YIM 133132]|uniref:MerR family transcriptional regulator n=1 Tax=Luteipulveratus flavus TaxID=3031728 RepID=UPI0023B10008|nr:MerR family transcriptional regulator [Luteipulveratus sp. YIM 133132]MDE9365161.1 MerR family transcriptional regulator [Luteipulveratus sp. YIM 133132]
MTGTSDLLPIGRFSALTRISVRMLRHYDEHDVLRPAYVDDATGYRWYATTQTDDALLVRQLRDVGFGVPAIGALLAARNGSTFGHALDQQRAVLVDDLRVASHRLTLIDRMREAHHQEQTMDITIDSTPFAARTVAALRGTIPTYGDEQQLWDRILPELGRQGIALTGPCGAIDLDEEYQERDVDKEVFVPVAPGTEAAEPLAVRELPEQPAARAVVTGPYEQLAEACDQLVRWAADRGTPGVAGMRYVYLNDPSTTPPEQLVTEVYLPISG